MTTMEETKPSSGTYPARLEIDYPDQLDRLTTLQRIFWIVPIAIILGLITKTNPRW